MNNFKDLKLKIYKNLNLPTKNRNTKIVKFFLNKTFILHNGKKVKKIFVNENKLGCNFGEFFFTRRYKKFKVEKKEKE